MSNLLVIFPIVHLQKIAFFMYFFYTFCHFIITSQLSHSFTSLGCCITSLRNTVDLVIFACFNFREFVIVELFVGSSFREFSILKKIIGRN